MCIRLNTTDMCDAHCLFKSSARTIHAYRRYIIRCGCLHTKQQSKTDQLIVTERRKLSFRMHLPGRVHALDPVSWWNFHLWVLCTLLRYAFWSIAVDRARAQLTMHRVGWQRPSVSIGIISVNSFLISNLNKVHFHLQHSMNSELTKMANQHSNHCLKLASI